MPAAALHSALAAAAAAVGLIQTDLLVGRYQDSQTEAVPLPFPEQLTRKNVLLGEYYVLSGFFLPSVRATLA